MKTTKRRSRHGKTTRSDQRGPSRSQWLSVPITCVTQNVRGLTQVDDWFGGLRAKVDGKQPDLVLLQEVPTAKEVVDRLKAEYARGWGRTDLDWSIWAETDTHERGVAILCRPDGPITNMTPIWRDAWSARFMAVTANIDGREHVIVNIYAPSGRKKTREHFYRALLACPKPEGPILLGGDFNCTLNAEFDRSSLSTEVHDSPALQELISLWGLQDALQYDIDHSQTAADTTEFHVQNHTFSYKRKSGGLATSRLDRWYVSRRYISHVLEVRTRTPVADSDHNAVILDYVSTYGKPRRQGKRRRPGLRYPLPFGCRDEVTAVCLELLQRFKEASSGASAVEAALLWDECKLEIRRAALEAIRECRAQQRRAYRQRRRRLYRALRRALERTGDDRDTASEEARHIRTEIIRLHRRRTSRRRRRRWRLATSGTPEAERAFFNRYKSTKAQPIVTLPDEPGTPSLPMAERLACAWDPVTQRGQLPDEDINAFFATLPPAMDAPDLSCLDDDFTEDEVRTALKSCPRGKASGPDGLPNDWYHEHADSLVEALTPMYNLWHRSNILPRSFKRATIACIPKKAQPQSGLDFRPIALLDTDYKIYSRLLLNRVRPHLSQLVSPTQFGFVPGRQVHDALDTFHALQATARDNQQFVDAIAVLLDFEKAYDSLDRTFLARALGRLGFPPRFIAAARQMHLATTAEFAANAEVSTEHPILNCIRQGCPLAPTLFVLAVDLLYKALAHDSDLCGIHLPNGEEVRATGYADDTTVYLHSPQYLQRLLTDLDRFRRASGLKVNLTKSVVVYLNTKANRDPAAETGFAVADPQTLTRLLGGQVACSPSLTVIWDMTLQKTRARLHLAELKTTNVRQRIKLLRAVLLPQFLFIARHHWPSIAVVDRWQRLVDSYTWSSSFATDGQRRKRAWMAQHVAQQSLRDGGLNAINLRHELQCLSLTTVERWAEPCSGFRRQIGAILLRSQGADRIFAGPDRKQPSTPTLQPSLGATGVQLRRAMLAQPRHPSELELYLQTRATLLDEETPQHSWHHGWLHADYSGIAHKLQPLRHLQETLHGRLDVPTLLNTVPDGSDVLLGATGLATRRTDFNNFIHTGLRFRDLLEVEWIDENNPYQCSM